MHTPEQKKHIAAVYAAAAEKKQTQWLDVNGIWVNDDPYSASQSIVQYPDRWRVAPKKRVRDWDRTSDVPLNCWLSDDVANGYRGFVTSVNPNGIRVGDGDQSEFITWHEIAGYKWTTDGKTWRDCTVEESE